MNHDSVRNAWAERSGEYSPTYYAYRGPDERSERVRARLERHLGADASVLELGCGPGRHLAHLADHGFEDLTGVDINPEAFEVMADSYPDLAAAGDFRCGAIEEVVTEFADDRFDAVFSVETLQHVHPDAADAFAEIARITADTLVTVENEGPGEDPPSGVGVNYVREDLPLYYRDWGRVFGSLGLVEADVERGDRDTARTFRTAR